MKIRTDFVTNSSSASYIVCFSRIADKEKAQKIIDKYNLNTYDRYGLQEVCDGDYEFEVDWAGIWFSVKSIVEEHPDDKFVVITDYCDASYNDDGEPEYDYDFSMNDAISALTNENGFDNIRSCIGEGRDG